jgi:hypothetical protein
LAKPNYAFQKRQRDLAKKQRKEAKLQKKAEAAAAPDAATDAAPDATPVEPSTPTEKSAP